MTKFHTLFASLLFSFVIISWVIPVVAVSHGIGSGV